MINKNKVSEIIKFAQLERKRACLTLDQPIDIFNFINSKGIIIKFDPISADDGITITGKQTMFKISMLRPFLRQRFSCAHEYAHYIFNKNRFVSDNQEDEECAADIFAGELLSPKQVILKGFRSRGLDYRYPSLHSIMSISGWIGVSNLALLTQMRNYRMITTENYYKFKNIKASEYRNSIMNMNLDAHIYLIDQHWYSRPIDLLTTEYLLVQNDIKVTQHNLNMLQEIDNYILYKAVSPGCNTVYVNENEYKIRIREKEYQGVFSNKYWSTNV